jgi:hypothetical protein
MKTILRNFETGLYLERSGKWTSDPEEALMFPDQLRATAYQIRHRLTDTFVVVLPEVAEPELHHTTSA